MGRRRVPARASERRPGRARRQEPARASGGGRGGRGGRSRRGRRGGGRGGRGGRSRRGLRSGGRGGRGGGRRGGGRGGRGGGSRRGGGRRGGARAGAHGRDRGRRGGDRRDGCGCTSGGEVGGRRRRGETAGRYEGRKREDEGAATDATGPVWAHRSVLSESAKLRASQVQRLPPSVAATIVLHAAFTSRAHRKPCVQRSNTPLTGRLAPLGARSECLARAERSPRQGSRSGKSGLGEPHLGFEGRRLGLARPIAEASRCSIVAPRTAFTIGHAAAPPPRARLSVVGPPGMC